MRDKYQQTEKLYFRKIPDPARFQSNVYERGLVILWSSSISASWPAIQLLSYTSPYLMAILFPWSLRLFISQAMRDTVHILTQLHDQTDNTGCLFFIPSLPSQPNQPVALLVQWSL